MESWFRSGTELFHQVYTYHEVLVPVLFQVCYCKLLSWQKDVTKSEICSFTNSRDLPHNFTILSITPEEEIADCLGPIVSLFYFSRLLSRCTGKKWSRRAFSFQPGSFREPLLRLTSKQVPLLCFAICSISSSSSDHIRSLLVHCSGLKSTASRNLGSRPDYTSGWRLEVDVATARGLLEDWLQLLSGCAINYI